MAFRGQYPDPAVAVVGAMLMAVVLVASPSAIAAEPVGRVLVVAGGATADRPAESARGLSRRDAVYAGDTIRTGARGRLQIRFDDGGLVDLEPNTDFEVAEYRDDDDGGSVVFNFIRGALRTLTGSIGGDSGSYRMNTPTATIGVRGTAYALRYCDADCVEGGGRAGLYGRVDDGAIQVDGPGGSGRFGAGQYFFIPDTGAPQRIVAPPEGILDGDDEGDAGSGGEERIEDVAIRALDGDAEGSAALGDGDDLFEPEIEQAGPDESGDRDPAAPTAPTGPTGLRGAAVAFDENQLPPDVHAATDESEFGTDGDRVVSADIGGFAVAVDGATLAESGRVDDLSVDWGRWEGTLTVDSSAADGELFYALTDNLTSPTVLGGLTGSFTYSFADGPGAVDQNNNLWSVNALDIGVDFTAASVSLVQFDLASSGPSMAFGPADVLLGSTDLDLGNNRFFIPLSQGLGGGSLTGSFVGSDADGAVVAFEVLDSDGVNHVVGVAVLRR